MKGLNKRIYYCTYPFGLWVFYNTPEKEIHRTLKKFLPDEVHDQISDVYCTYKGSLYNTLSGTSMATPHVAGLLLLGLNYDGVVTGDPDGQPDKIAHK